jgi:DNA repair exonuclease SbcCD nuclease subunit
MRDTLPKLCNHENITGLIINGDLTEEKDRHPAWLVNRIVGYVATCAQICPVYINKGNHDYTDIDNPFFAFLAHLPNVAWINRPTPNGVIGTVNLGIGLTYFFPHTTNYKKDWSADMLKTARKADWVFAHQTFADTEMQSGHVAGNIPRDIFGDARVLTGDVHIPRKLTPTVDYIGAPYTIDFGDDYQGRVLEVDRKGFKAIPYTGRQKRLVDISANSNDELLLKHLNKFRIGDIVKVRVTLTSGNRKVWPEVRNSVKEWAEEMKYELHSVVPVMEKGTSIKSTAKTYSKKSDSELLEKYAGNKGLDRPTRKVGEIIMRKV